MIQKMKQKQMFKSKTIYLLIQERKNSLNFLDFLFLKKNLQRLKYVAQSFLINIMRNVFATSLSCTLFSKK